MKYAKPFLLIACFVAAAGYLFLGTYEEVKRETIRQFNAQQLLLARQAAKGIENFFQERLADLEFFAARGPIIDFAAQGKEIIESYYHNHKEQVTAVLRTDAEGRVLHQEPFSPEMIGTDLSHLEHIQEVMRTRKPVISEVHASTSGFDCVEIHTPVFEESESRGSLGLSIPFEKLARDYLADIRVGKEGYAWMLSKKGIELYCPVPGHVGKPVSETCREFPSILAMAEEMMGGKEGAGTYIFDRVRERDVQSVRKHAVYTPVHLGNTIWSIVVATPEDEVLAAMQGFRGRWSFLMALLIAAGAVGAAYLGRAFLIVKEEARRKKVEEELRQTVERLETIVNGAPLGIILLNAKGHVLSWNPAAETMFGWSKQEVLGRPAPFVPQEQKETFLARISAELKGRARDSEDIQRLRKDGSMADVRIWTRPTRDDQGTITGTLGMLQDVTEMKSAEKALEQSEERLRTLIQAIPDIIMRFDRQLKHLYVSATVRSVLDMDPAVFAGRTHRELGFPEDLCRFWEDSIRKVFESGAPLEREFSYDGIRGQVVFNWRLIPETGDQGEVQTVLSICRDITEQKRTEVQLQQAQKMESIGRLAAGVAHDFNNMLSPILGYAEMLMMDLLPTDDRFRQVSEIKKAAERSRDLTRQLLAFSRKQVLELKAVDLGRLIQNFEKLLRRTLREDIELKLSLSVAPSTIMADVGQVEQVLMNLAVNAQDAMPDGGVLTLETGAAEADEEDRTLNPELKPCRYVTLAVSDTGIGMDEGTREHIFEPFFTTKGILGTGLGPATVYGIVKQHDGTIRVYTVPGKGTTFKIYLPAATLEGTAQSATTVATQEAHLGRSETVLVVEDNEMVREMTSRVLSRQGYTVISAASGRECLGLLKEYKGPLHLLLTDVIMPDMNGKELFDKVAESFPLARVIYMSGYTDSVIARHGILEEGVHFVQKPFSIQSLALKIREVLDRGNWR